MLILFIIFLFSTFIYIRETFEIEGQGGKWMWMPCINNTILFIYLFIQILNQIKIVMIVIVRLNFKMNARNE